MSSYYRQLQYSPSCHENSPQLTNLQPFENHPKPIFTPSYHTLGGYEYIQHAPDQYALTHAYEQALQQEGSWAYKKQEEILEQQAHYTCHAPTPAQFPTQPEKFQIQQVFQDYRNDQQHLGSLVLDLAKQLADFKRQKEVDLQQEELACQAYLRQQEIDAERYERELFAQQDAEKEEKMRQLIVRHQDLEAHEVSHTPNQFAIGAKLQWQPQWTQQPDYQMPNLAKDTPCAPVQGQEVEIHVAVLNSIEQEAEIQEYEQQRKKFEENLDRQIAAKTKELRLQATEQGGHKFKIPSWRTPLLQKPVNEEPSKLSTRRFTDILLAQPIIEHSQSCCDQQQNEDYQRRLVANEQQISEYDQLGQPVQDIAEKAGTEEESMFLFDELPDFVEQEEEDMVMTTLETSLQQQEDVDHHDDLLFHEVTIIEEAVQNEEINENLEEDYFSNNIEGFCENLGEELLFPMVEDCEQHNKLTEAAMFSVELQGETPCEVEEIIHKEEINKESCFVLSKGCPIKYFLMIETKYEEVVQEEKIAAQESQTLLTYPFQQNFMNNQLSEVGVFIFQEMFHLIMKNLFILSLAIYKFPGYATLGRKGRYFSEPVNGFV